MTGPGAYVPDVTEGITRIEDLPKPRIAIAAATTPAGAAPSVVVALVAGVWFPGRFMISVTRTAADRSTFMSATPSIAVRTVGAASPPTCPTWPRPSAITPTGCNRRPCDWWWRTTSPIAWPVGTCGATTASSSPGPPSRIGSRPRGKKSRAAIETDYLERAWSTSAAISPSMSCTTARSACSRWSTTEPSSACPSASWSTTRPRTTSAASWRLQGPTGRARPGSPGRHYRRLGSVPRAAP